MKYAITWLTLAVAIAVTIGSVNLPSLRRMVARGVVGTATVTELVPNVHNTVRYSYSVGAQSYTGQTQSSPPNPPLEQLKIGQQVVIYYDPQQPSHSVLGDPRPMLQNETISVAFAATLIPTVLVGRWAWLSSRKQGKRRVATAAA